MKRKTSQRKFITLRGSGYPTGLTTGRRIAAIPVIAVIAVIAGGHNHWIIKVKRYILPLPVGPLTKQTLGLDACGSSVMCASMIASQTTHCFCVGVASMPICNHGLRGGSSDGMAFGFTNRKKIWARVLELLCKTDWICTIAFCSATSSAMGSEGGKCHN